MSLGRARFNVPFQPGHRASGVLLRVTSPPLRYGIGDVGPSAYAWVDQLAAAGQAWWQVPPLGPTGYGHSSCQALSSFATNPIILSPEQLTADGLVSADNCRDGRDGLVRHQIAPVDRVKSEFIVNSKHSYLNQPATIEEVRRILHEHLKTLPPARTLQTGFSGSFNLAALSN